MSEIKFGFIPVASDLMTVNPEEVANEIWQRLIQLNGRKIENESIQDSLPVFYFILTGGTEQKVLNLISERKKYFENEPVFLIAHPENNSLAASIEILAYLQQNDYKGKIFYLDENSNKECFDELEKTIKHFNIFHQMKKIKIGLIGEPSDWLVASNPKIDSIKNIWGPEVINISIQELITEIENVNDNETEDDNYTFTKKATEIKEPSKKEIKNVVKVYAALKKIINKYKVNAISVRCFDLVTQLNTTGCFALSKLNDDGIIAGCEGDLISTLGMIWVNMMTDQSVWMANPAQLDEQNNSIVFAHCTVPISMTQNYKLRSHFESGLGVGIQGELSKGKITLLRIGGKNLEKIWLTNGEIIESGNQENLCRTQVKVKLHGSSKPSDLLTSPLGNHILIFRGNYTKELFNWWENFVG